MASAATADDDPPAETDATRAAPIIYRHRLPTRIWHWLNAIAIVVMLMSGLMIFNAHPRLYWGAYGANPDPAWLAIGSDGAHGFLQIGPLQIPTTGLLGMWRDGHGVVQHRAFPGWATIPSHYDLAGARTWHLSMAWVLAIAALGYWLWSLIGRHFRRDLAPRRGELGWSHIWQDVKDHARLRLPTGDAALRYNILQKLAYLGLIFAALPLIILTGLTMSPGMDADWRWLLTLFGGRQSARSIHFICAMAIALFILVHLVMVVLAGPWNEVRSMVTGWFRAPPPRRADR